jgi:hypothetical protein
MKRLLKWKRQGKLKYPEYPRPRATLPTTNPTRRDLGSNLGHRGGKPVTCIERYGAAPGISKCMHPSFVRRQRRKKQKSSMIRMNGDRKRGRRNPRKRTRNEKQRRRKWTRKKIQKGSRQIRKAESEHQGVKIKRK